MAENDSSMVLRWGQKLLQCTLLFAEDIMKKCKNKSQQSAVDHGRGSIANNALAALVTSVIFRCKVEKPKKGKGAYSRKQNHQGHLQGAPDAFWA
jgi:alternative ribosome-rescue factor